MSYFLLIHDEIDWYWNGQYDSLESVKEVVGRGGGYPYKIIEGQIVESHEEDYDEF